MGTPGWEKNQKGEEWPRSFFELLLFFTLLLLISNKRWRKTPCGYIAGKIRTKWKNRELDFLLKHAPYNQFTTTLLKSNFCFNCISEFEMILTDFKFIHQTQTQNPEFNCAGV